MQWFIKRQMIMCGDAKPETRYNLCNYLGIVLVIIYKVENFIYWVY